MITTGNIEREIWLKSLLRISNPVIKNLAHDDLKNHLPVSFGPGYDKKYKEVTYIEAVCRTICGLSAWLEFTDKENPEDTIRQEYKRLVLDGINNAFCIESKDYLNFDIEHPQPIIEAGYLAQAFIRAPTQLWKPLESSTKRSIIQAFKSLRNRTGPYNNWLLFSALTESFLLSIDEDYDPARINFCINSVNEWYVGDGWFSDGISFSFDYYNSFVIHPFLIDIYQLLVGRGLLSKMVLNRELERLSRYSEFLERLVAPDGSFPVFGRSVTYRFASFYGLATAILLDRLPVTVTKGQIRSALTEVIKRLFNGNQNFDHDGWLRLGVNGQQDAIADSYTSTGSLYITTIGFLPLGLGANDEFWISPSEKWTSLKVWGGDSNVKRMEKFER